MTRRRTSLTRFLLCIAAVASLLPGCLPIELEASGDGKLLIARQEGFFTYDPASGKVALAYQPVAGQPVFARFVPGGKQMIAVTTPTGGPKGRDFKVELVTIGAGATATLATTTAITYLTVSPDGKAIAFTRLADAQADLGNNQHENLPELHVVELATGKETVFKSLGAVGGLHRWFPDSKSLLVFQVTSKRNMLYVGTLAKVSIAAQESTPLASALGPLSSCLALSPDGKKALFAAVVADKPGVELKLPDDPEGPHEPLYELDVERGGLRIAAKAAHAAFYSPSGKRVLLMTGSAPDSRLAVASADVSEITEVAHDVAAEWVENTRIYPAWVTDDQIAYLAVRAVYGRSGVNLELVTISADGKTRKVHQPVIDAEASKAD